MKLKLIAFSLFALAGTAFSAVTVNTRNFSSQTVGVPIVDGSGAALAVGSYFASAGYFTSTPEFETATASSLLALFNAVDSTPLGGTTFNGLWTGQDFNGASLGAAVGQDAYVLVGNNSTLASSTLIAVFDAGTTFVGPDTFGNSAQTLNATTAGQVVFGNVRGVTTQPNLSGAAFAQGVQLVAVAIPEPSAALLGAIGALGLLRRRRI